MVAVSLYRLGWVGHDEDLSGGSTGDAPRQISGAEHHLDGRDEPLCRVGPAEDDQVQLAVGRIDRPARSDTAGDEVAGGDGQGEVALDLEKVPVRLDVEAG